MTTTTTDTTAPTVRLVILHKRPGRTNRGIAGYRMETLSGKFIQSFQGGREARKVAVAYATEHGWTVAPAR